MATKPILIANSSSGAGAGAGDDGLDEWCAVLGIERRDPGDDLVEAVRDAATSEPPFIAVSGGDGTLRCAAEVLADTDIPLLPVPGGTFNHFARSLGIADLESAAAAARSEVVDTIPVPEVNDEVFLNTCVVGWYPEMVATRELLRTKMPRPLALLVAFVRHLRQMEAFWVDIADEPRRVWSLWVGAAKFGLDPGQLNARGREDVLDVRLMLAHARYSRTLLIWDLMRGRLRDSDHLDRFIAEGEVSARLGSRRVTAALDAEVLELDQPLVLTPARRKLLVKVPPADAVKSTAVPPALRDRQTGNVESAIRDVYVIARRGEDVLLLLRSGTGYRDGEWGPPSGKVEADETYLDAAVRELAEETGLVVAPDALTCVHTIERTSSDNDHWVGLFFEVDVSAIGAEPENREPRKHSEISFFPADQLPDSTVDYVAQVLAALAAGDRHTDWHYPAVEDV